VDCTAALTQRCTNKASEDHWWDSKGLILKIIYERISVMFFGGEIWQPRDKKFGGRGMWLATSIMDFEGEKLVGNPHIMRKNFLKSSF
jgi:hypothetical protein